MKKNPDNATAEAVNQRWAALLVVLIIAACMPMAACSQPIGNNSKDEKKMSNRQGDKAYFDVSAISYIERPIFEIKLNGIEVGTGGGGLMTGVAVKLGPQSVTWRLDGPKGTPGNGDTVKAKNTPILTKVDPNFRYLGVHIYPDNTVEIIPERYWPEKTEKGEAINRASELKHGK